MSTDQAVLLEPEGRMEERVSTDDTIRQRPANTAHFETVRVDSMQDGVVGETKHRPMEPDQAIQEEGMLLHAGAEDIEEGGGGFCDPDVDRLYPQKPVYCTGCSTYRIAMAPMGILVAFLVGITWYSYVFLTPRASVLELIIFHLLLALLVGSYLQCSLMDPGTVPAGWHAAVARSHLRSRYAICRKSNMFKPPRSHFDSITKRLVLNMDHYCPWLINCIGFYNRKFFVLFLMWTSITSAYFVLAVAIHADFQLQRVMLDEKSGRMTVVKFMAFIIDAALAIAVLGFFLFHLKLVLFNETTIEDDGSRFNMGYRKNFESVFGANPYLWFIPVFGNGPVGDGVHWPRPDGGQSGVEMHDAGSEGSDEGWEA